MLCRSRFGSLFKLLYSFALVLLSAANTQSYGQALKGRVKDIYEQYNKTIAVVSDPKQKIDTLLHYASEFSYYSIAAETSKVISQQAISLSRDMDYRYGLMRGYMNIGNIYIAQGQADQALYYYNEALKISKQNEYGLADALYANIASIYQAQDKYELSLQYYYYSNDAIQKGFSIDGLQTAASCLAINYANMAALFDKLYNPEQALFYADLALDLGKMIHDRIIQSSVLNTKANVLLEMNETEAAEQLCRQSLEMAIEERVADLKSAALQLFGDISLKRRDTMKALAYYKEANPQYLSALDKIDILCKLGKTFYYLRSLDSSEKYLLQALDLSKQYDAKRSLAEIYDLLSSINIKRGNYKTAAVFYNLYKPLKDSISDIERNRMVYTLDMKYRTAEKDKNIALKQLLITQQKVSITRKNFWIWTLSGGTGIIIIFLVLYNFQKQRIHAEQINSLKQQEKIHSLLAMTSGEEKERKRVARDLHDGIGGLLSTLKLYFLNIQKKQPELRVNEEYADAMNLLEQTLKEVRKTAHNLMPELLLQHGLPEAVRLFCNSIQKLQHIKIDFQYYGFIGRLNQNFELFIYRIIQELIQNILKHSEAENVLIQLSLHESILNITVEDDGVGIKPKENSNGIGLSSIQSRIKELNGEININSTGKGGTSIFIEFDLQRQEILTHED